MSAPEADAAAEKVSQEVAEAAGMTEQEARNFRGGSGAGGGVSGAGGGGGREMEPSWRILDGSSKVLLARSVFAAWCC